ncbi:AAA family ATPase [Candidatus Marithrix sp. Canyon 246]|uniref:AAA family ATPase n=1 Tax=Candidatus Marithrix sp. Canyon 246 TaxID=1827136 RepID=UPI00084A0379|nr:ATP-binding protein [Candidatus Marithrix sp. Canyon 246]
MQLKRFAVKGFKNFQTEIVLENLNAIAVIHGENNVGKSNLLEAMQLFFQLLLVQDGLAKKMRFSELEEQGFYPSNIFNLEKPVPIEINVTFTLQPEELELADIQPLLPSSKVQIAIQLKHLNSDNLDYKITKYQFANGTDVSHHEVSAEQKTYAARLALFLAQHFILKTKETSNRFALIRLDRRISPDEIEAERSVVPQALSLQLYDAKESPEPSHYKRWELFVKIMKKFNDVLNLGEFVVLFNRHTGRANLAFQSPSTRIPIDLLGSGIQQIIALIARLLMSNANFVAIEEPELNLRYTLQLRLREIFKDIIEAPVGPQQLFLTSHSPAFEFGKHFYAMRQINGIPTVELKSIKQAILFTHHHADSPYLVGKEHAPLCYVSTDGLVRLPERIRQRLELEQGGGIVLLERKDTGHVELLTDKQFDNLFAEPVD